MSVKIFLPSLLVLALAACAVGPDYKTQQLEAANITAAADTKSYDHAQYEGIWWQQFDDPTLNQLVTQSLSGNRDLRVAFARLRLRPILMTSFAFIMGVVPLVLSSGAGAEMRHAMGVAVFSGMLGVTFFGLFLTPVFYVLMRTLEKRVTGTEAVHHHIS